MESTGVDIWALGCIIAELYNRRPLFAERNLGLQMVSIFRTLGTPKDISWIVSHSLRDNVKSLGVVEAVDLAPKLPGSSNLAQDFVKFILMVNPEKRPSAVEVIDHPFLSSTRFHKQCKNRYQKSCHEFKMSEEFEKQTGLMGTLKGLRNLMFEELTDFQRRIDRNGDKYRSSLEEMNEYYIGMLVERYLALVVAQNDTEILPLEIGKMIHSYCVLEEYSISEREIQGVGNILTYQWKKANQKAKKEQSETSANAQK